MSLWQKMLDRAEPIFTQLEAHGAFLMRVLADGEVVVQAYGVLEPLDIVRAARGAAPFYPNAQTLEVCSVRPDVGGAIVRRVVRFTAQAVPTSSAQQREAVSA